MESPALRPKAADCSSSSAGAGLADYEQRCDWYD